MPEIRSIKNPLVKQLMQLQKKSSLRKREALFVVEGRREVYAVIRNKYRVKKVFYNLDLIEEQEIFKWMHDALSAFEMVKISKDVYQKLAYRNSTEGVLALVETKNHSFKNIKLPKNPLLFVAEQIEKPGNVGAMLRTADAAGVDAFVLIDSVVDLYNPNIIRSSLGTVFSNQIVTGNIDDLVGLLKRYDIKLFAATLQNSNKYFEENFSQPTAIAVGAEDRGLSSRMREIAYKSIYIPMNGQADSLNVSVSGAVLIYEVVKQRMQKIQKT